MLAAREEPLGCVDHHPDLRQRAKCCGGHQGAHRPIELAVLSEQIDGDEKQEERPDQPVSLIRIGGKSQGKTNEDRAKQRVP